MPASSAANPPTPNLSAPNPSAPNPPVHGSAFRYRAFSLFWGTRVSTMLAGQMQAVAVGWQVYDLTHDPADLGLVGLFQFLPTLVLTLVAGHTVDSYDRRRILIVCLLAELLCMAALTAMTVTDAVRPVLIFAVVAVIGMAKAFEMPANQSLVSATVPMEVLPNAVAWNSSAMQTAFIAGPAVGGLLYMAGPAVVYGAALLLVANATTLMAMMRPRPVTLVRRAVNWPTLLAGIAFIRSRPAILGAISLDLFAVLLGGATALLPVYARDILLTGPWGLGLLRSAPALGALAMAVALAHRPLTRAAGRLMLAAVAVFGVATIVFGLSANPVVSFIALVILGASDQISVFVRQTLIQLSTPDDMRGRVGAVSSLFIGASNQLGEFESGATAALFGTVPAVIVGGVGTLLVAGLWAWRFPELRKVEKLAAVHRS